MPVTLQETLLAPETQPQVIDDCHALLQQQVSDGSGISGTAVKIAYKTVNTVFPGHVRYMVESLLPDMVGELEPFWADFHASGDSDFGGYLATRGEEVSEALLSVTDKRGAALRAAHRRQDVRQGPPQRGQARHGRAPAGRRPRTEVRALTTRRHSSGRR